MFEYKFKANKNISPFDIHGLNKELGTYCSYAEDDRTVVIRTDLPLTREYVKTHHIGFSLVDKRPLKIEDCNVFYINMVKQIHRSATNKKESVVSDYGVNEEFLIQYLNSNEFSDISIESLNVLPDFTSPSKDFYITGAFTIRFTAKINSDRMKWRLSNSVGQKTSYGFGAVRLLK